MRPFILLAVFLLTIPFAYADEGMWLFNAFPTEKVKALGTQVDDAWLSKARLGSLRLAGGCSASFVSSDGLVMTNHHCIRSCLEDLSTPSRNLLATPFVAKTKEAEEQCVKTEANQLTDIVDVTARVLASTKTLEGAEYQKQLKATVSAIENECAQGDAKKRCDVVTLFNGAQFHLYVYRRFQDLRLVFAPEFRMAAFGGDPDNFNFPRYGSDFAFLRVWENGKPRPTPEALHFSKTPAKEGDLTFVSGHPGGTERNRTVAQLEFQRDFALPWTLMGLSEARGRLDEWMKGDAERARVGASLLRSIENGLKSQRGRQQALVSPAFLPSKRAEEKMLAEKVPDAKAAFAAIERAMADFAPLYGDYRLWEGQEAFAGELFGYARRLVRFAEERGKPQAERLPEYTDARLPALQQMMGGAAPVSQALETALLTWSLTRLQNLKGADHPLVRGLIGKKSPAAVATELVGATKLGDAAFRKAVLAGEAKIDTDAMLVFAKKTDAAARALRTQVETKVEAVVKKNFEVIQGARKTVYGTAGYPDATFSLRLSYGKVSGVAGQPAMTTVGGFFERLTGTFPFAASEPWLNAQKAIAPATPFNFCTTNDIIGGNSGSPMLNAKGEVIGLVFDGNLPSLAGNFYFDGTENRTVAVHASLIRNALSKVYGAAHVEAELMR
jgi:Peptidase S46